MCVCVSVVHQVWWLISNNEKGMGKDDLEQRNEEQYVYSVLFDLSFETKYTFVN